jgi:UDP-glucose 4-epimerase
METILITGGMGFIGSHTCVELIHKGYHPIIVDDLSNSSSQMLEGIRRITGVSVPFYQMDVADEALSHIFQDHPIDAVIHFAGFKAVGESRDAPLSYYCNNLNTTMNLLKQMSRHGVSRLVFSSSATVYDTMRHVILTEETERGYCQSPYGWTKFMSEQIITDYARANPGIAAVLLRYFNPVGAHESGEIGEAPNGVPQNLMPFVTQVAVGLRERLSVFGGDYETPDGTCVRDYIHITDLARGHVAALRYAQENPGAESFNLGTGQGISVLEVVRTFQQANGVEIPYTITGRRAGDAPMYYADTQKAEDVLGWRAERDLENMCRSAYTWQKKSMGLL